MSVRNVIPIANEITPASADVLVPDSEWMNHVDGNEPCEDAERRLSTDALAILDSWIDGGPLVHQATGFKSIDEASRGGWIYGRRHYIIGAPGAGKTATANRIGATYLEEGCVVGVLAVDEAPDEVCVRYLQMLASANQSECESRDPSGLAVLKDRIAPYAARLRFFDGTCSIEEAAEEIAKLAKATGRRGVLIVDSTQTARSLRAREETDDRKIIDLNVQAIREAAALGLLVIATSEMNRSAYRNVQSADASNDMAAAKGSSAIEYSAQFLLALRSVKGEPNLIEATIVKNRGGVAGKTFFISLERRHHDLTEVDAPEEAPKESAEKLSGDVQLVREALLNNSPNGVAGRSGIRTAVRLLAHSRGVQIGDQRIDLAVASLGVDETGDTPSAQIANRPEKGKPRWHLRGASGEI